MPLSGMAANTLGVREGAHELKVCAEGQLIFYTTSAGSCVPEEMEKPYHARNKARKACTTMRPSCQFAVVSLPICPW
jgi:hypothetical protein